MTKIEDMMDDNGEVLKTEFIQITKNTSFWKACLDAKSSNKVKMNMVLAGSQDQSEYWSL